MKIATLIKKFDNDYNFYTKPIHKYNESQTRSDFINPFFEILGWDIQNTKIYPIMLEKLFLKIL